MAKKDIIWSVLVLKKVKCLTWLALIEVLLRLDRFSLESELDEAGEDLGELPNRR